MKTRIRVVLILFFGSFLMQAQISKKKLDAELNQINNMVTEAKAVADQVINDDLIVTSSACLGFDCVNGESFGADTERLKENNLRIHFDDTSSSGSFPSNDWRIRINDQANGGASYFAVEDATAGRTPFTIEAGALTNALYVESDGDVGFGTSNPVVNLHAVDGNTPTLRLEQDASSGFTAQTWDMAGNETSFFIRDVTNGSKLPFRIYPNSPSNSLEIKSTGVNIKNVTLIDPASPSDLRLKTELTAIKDATNVLLKLYPKTFYFIKKAIKEFGFPSDIQYGLVAQEVEKVLPDLITNFSLGDNKEEFKSVQYEALIPLLIQGFKEQQQLILAQKEKIDKMEAKLNDYASLDGRLKSLENKQNKVTNAKR